LISFSCQKEKVKKEYEPSYAHGAYIYSLKQANLQNTILFKQFVESSEKALSEPLLVSIPYSEMFYIDHSSPEASGYRFFLKRGQKIKIKTDKFNKDSVQLFIDVFRIKDTANTSWYKVASADKDSLYLEFVARRDAEYILRIQSELLCDVQCKVKIELESSLAFPVIGKDKNSIQSFFGDPRDGGRRDHHGVDIFASRHTDVLASTDGYVGRTGTSRIGGKYVWVYYPSLGINCYYAHLETIDIGRGKKIKEGTKLGTVGNTGNAKYTPPHLHFGIYQSGLGPVDPYFFIATDNTKAKEVSKSTDLLGKSIRTNYENVKFHTFDSVLVLPMNTNLIVEAVNTSKLRVQLSDGKKGFIKINEAEADIQALYSYTNKSITKLCNKPSCDGLEIRKIQLGEELQILSYYQDYCKVKLQTGEIGWLLSTDLIQS
jgi:murein DD-endopeptidase MepM/ murein hydrolase activator NlpD